eukprot:4925989-Pyramimonas_sp.AAC.1
MARPGATAKRATTSATPTQLKSSTQASATKSTRPTRTPGGGSTTRGRFNDLKLARGLCPVVALVGGSSGSAAASSGGSRGRG